MRCSFRCFLFWVLLCVWLSYSRTGRKIKWTKPLALQSSISQKQICPMFPNCLDYYLLQMENLLWFFYVLSQEKVPLSSCSASEKVAKCTLQTHQCETIYLSDRRTKKHSGCFGYFFFLCYCFSLEWGTNHCNLLLFLLFFQLYSSFRRSLSVLWKSPKNNKTQSWQWNKTMCGSMHAQENTMIAVVNLIWQFLILKYMTLWLFLWCGLGIQ